MTQEQAADRFGLSKGGYTKIEDGDRGLKVDRIARAAEIYGVDPAVIIGQISDEDLAKVAKGNNNSTSAREISGTRDDSNVRIAAEPTKPLGAFKGPRDVPVLGTGVCGDDGDFRFNGQTIDYAPRPPGIEGKRDVFVVYVVGDSMAERYEDGDPLYVDPHRRPKPRDIVIVELKAPSEGEPGSAFVKRLVRRGGGKIVVEQFNPPKELVFDEDEVARLHRVIPWIELIGM
ncbi:helix-turn-helix domain-containing protein [Methylobacterium sp. E-005]|nr:helix-turn-helix domain-containing protein [Methylobacterium sp. E-005]